MNLTNEEAKVTVKTIKKYEISQLASPGFYTTWFSSTELLKRRAISTRPAKYQKNITGAAEKKFEGVTQNENKNFSILYFFNEEFSEYCKL